MSTLNVSNITDGTTTVGTSYVVNGSAKAWANINGTNTISSRDSLNVSSLTDTGTGRHGLNFTNDFSSSDFCASGSMRGTHDGSTNLVWMQDSEISKSASKVSYVVKRGNTAASNDNADEHTHIHGDLA